MFFKSVFRKFRKCLISMKLNVASYGGIWKFIRTIKPILYENYKSIRFRP